MARIRITPGLALSTAALAFGTLFFGVCIMLRNEPVIGVRGTGFQESLAHHLVLFGSFFFVLGLLAFLGALGKAQGKRSASRFTAAAFLLSALWVGVGAAVGIFGSETPGANGAWPNVGVGQLVVSAAMSLVLTYLGVRSLRQAG